MKQKDKEALEALLLGVITALYRETGVKIDEIIPDFDTEQFLKLYEPLTQNKETIDDALKYLANDIYKRVSKKFTKG